MHRFILVLLLVLTLPGAAPSVMATVLVPAEFREIVAGSQVIVHGRVTDVSAEWTPDRRRIDSIVTIEVGTYLKGGPAERVTFRAPGGQIGRYKSITVGAPEFRPGDEAIFFLTARRPAMARVFGMSQGLYRIRVDRAGRRVVVPPAVIAHADTPRIVARGGADRRSLPLDDFAAQVRDALGRPGVAR